MPPPLDYPPQAHTDTRGLSNDSLANALVLAIINESAVPAATNPNAGNATNATKKPTGRTGDFVVDNLRYAAAQKALYAKGGWLRWATRSPGSATAGWWRWRGTACSG